MGGFALRGRHRPRHRRGFRPPGTEIGYDVPADLADRPHLRPLRHGAHLPAEQDLVGAGLDQAVHIGDALIRGSEGLVGVADGFGRLLGIGVHAHFFGAEARDDNLAGLVHVLVPACRVRLRAALVPPRQAFVEIALAANADFARLVAVLQHHGWAQRGDVLDRPITHLVLGSALGEGLAVDAALLADIVRTAEAGAQPAETT